MEGSRDHAVCELDIKDHHRNALGNVMGGAIFTLADFALAIASNTGENPSVSVSSTIEYLSASNGLPRERVAPRDTRQQKGPNRGPFQL